MCELDKGENFLCTLARNVLFAFAFAALIIWLTGCSSVLTELHSKEITQGCEMVEARAKLGYFNQEGTGSACKMISSPDLPEGYKYSYNNGQCKLSVGE